MAILGGPCPLSFSIIFVQSRSHEELDCRPSPLVFPRRQKHDLATTSLSVVSQRQVEAIAVSALRSAGNRDNTHVHRYGVGMAHFKGPPRERRTMNGGSPAGVSQS